MSLTFRRRPAPAVSEAEVSRAWRRYLRETREAVPGEYRLVEERAWRRLASNLDALGAPPKRSDGSADP